MHIGQKVEFIGVGKFKSLPLGEPHPILGQIYTVRELYQCAWEEIPGIRVCEIYRPLLRWGSIVMEMGWNRLEFRPLTNRKTDISIFQKMLTTELV